MVLDITLRSTGEIKMALPGEVTNVQNGMYCPDCKKDKPKERVYMPLKVLHSPAGYYIGMSCPNCGPYSRESGYYKDRDVAQAAMDNDDYYRN